MTGLPAYLGILSDAETHLADALTMIADRHSSDADVRDTAQLLARWSRRHIDAIEPHLDRHGVRDMPDPDRLRAALFHGARTGGLGLLRDLHELLTLANYVRGAWAAVFQAAMELHEEALATLCTTAAEDVDRQITWLKTKVRLVAPQALTVPPAKLQELVASLPKSPTPASLPEAVWAPVAGALTIAIVGVLALIAGQPWLLPSLGPTAYLLAEIPAHPSTRVYNIIAGHLIGLAAGIAAVWLTGAMADPVVLETGVVSGARVGAAVLALGLTLLGTLALQASHPPAGASTLLVALGSLSTPLDALGVGIGAAVVAATGYGLRGLRLAWWPRRRETHVPAVAGTAAITQPVAPEFKKAA